MTNSSSTTPEEKPSPKPPLDERAVLGRVWFSLLTGFCLLPLGGGVVFTYVGVSYPELTAEHRLGFLVPGALFILGGSIAFLACLYEALSAWFSPTFFLRRWYVSATGFKEDKTT